MMYVMIGAVEQRLARKYNYYLGRTAGELPGYFSNISKAPLKPLASITHVADGVLRTTSDIARLFQEDKRPIPPLAERGRFMESIVGAGQDVLGGIGDLTRGKIFSALGKEVGAVLQIGDAVLGGVADLSDSALGADHGASYAQAA